MSAKRKQIHHVRGIKAWMILQGLEQKDLARELRCSTTAISRVLHGYSTSKRIVRHFIQQGCPPEYFEIERPQS